MWLKSFLKTCVATAVYALIHSALASARSKRSSELLVGPRYRGALYRPFYLAQSLATMAALVWYVRRLPSKTLYHLSGPAAVPFRLVQLGGLAWAVYAAYEVGLADILGIRGLAQLSRGDHEILPEPEAQGPSATPEGTMRINGPFRLSRHPLNFAPLPVAWFNPRMTTNLLAFNLVATLYLVLGSMHEESRLRDAYGSEYRAYQRSGVPFYLPAVR